MPNGTSAPGKVLPPPVVQVRVSTIVAGAVTVGVAWAVLRAAAGILAAGTLPAQLTGRPSVPSVQVAAGVADRPPAFDVGGGLGLGDGLGAAGAAPAGAATSQAAMHSTTAQTVPMRACRFNWD